MSQPTKPFHEMGVDQLTKQLPDLLSFEQNKPDFKELDLGSRYQTKPTTSIPSSRNHSISPNKNNGNNRIQQHHSGELMRSAATCRNLNPGHSRSSSTGAPYIYSGSPASGSSSTSSSSSSSSGGNNNNTNNNNNNNGGNILSSSSVSSSPSNILYPTGNICPSGKILKSNMLVRTGNRAEKLGSGTVNYGHGNIMKRGNVATTTTTTSCDAEEVKKMGNDMYRRGSFSEALVLYDRAVGISPDNAAYRSNRAAALTMLGRVGEAVRECEEAVRLDSAYGRAHQRLASLYLRLGQIEIARHHLYFNGQNPDTTEVRKLLSLESHINRCSDARKLGDWKAVLRECDAAMVAGAVSSPQIVACKAEALLKLQQHVDADSSLSDLPKIDPYPASCSHTKFFGILAEAYVLYVQAKVDMVFGRFENAAAAAEKAGLIDYNNIEVAMLLNNVKLISRARSLCKDLFSAGKFAEASSAYGEGLKYNLCNSILYCNRAVCWSKLGLWEQSVEDCNHALKIQPNYTKALLRRAVSNAKLERWEEAVRDYEVLKRELPGDCEVVESLSRAQDALKKSSRDNTYYSKPVVAGALSVPGRFNGLTCLPGGFQADASRSQKNCPDL